MKISVVIPTYRRPHLLVKCLDALFQQSFSSKDFEIIVVSDGPDDLTEEAALSVLANSTSRSIKFLSTPIKGGPAAARNLGWKSASGDLIAFTDDDCLPDQHWLTKLWQCYANIDYEHVAFSGRTIVPVSDPPTDYELNISNLERAEFITANCACSREVLELTEGFDERFKMAWREDSDFHFMCLDYGIPIIKVPDAIVTHPVRKHPWAVSLKDEKKGVFNVLLYKKFPTLYKERIEPHIPLNYYVIVLSIVIFLGAVLFGNYDIAAIAFGVWLVLTLSFAVKRLQKTKRSFSHIMEMIVTSMVIPVLSVFYRCYGAIKYRVLLP